MKPLEGCIVAVVGLGLMGGSLAGALRGQCREVLGVARHPESIDAAIQRDLIDRGGTDAAALLPRADVVVLATPVRVILQQIREFGPLLAKGALLMDLGSTKREILAVMEGLPEGVQALGGHPMCGKEASGLEAADPSLYRGRTFILCPLGRTTRDALDLGRKIAEAAGATPLTLDGVRQDHLVATISHLPYLLACSLVQTADETTSSDPAAWQVVADGYRDTSRVAGSDVTMMTDILMTNRADVMNAARVFSAKLSGLVELLDQEDEQALIDMLTSSRAERRRMFP